MKYNINRRFADKIKCEQHRNKEMHQLPLSHVPDEVYLNIALGLFLVTNPDPAPYGYNPRKRIYTSLIFLVTFAKT